MASLFEPVVIDKNLISQSLLVLKKKHKGLAVICEIAMDYYKTHVRNDLEIYHNSIILGDYSYYYELVAYRKTKNDYVVMSLFIDSMTDYSQPNTYDWVCNIIDRRSFYSSDELLANYRLKCGVSYSGGILLYVSQSLTDHNVKRDIDTFEKLKKWMETVENQEIVEKPLLEKYDARHKSYECVVC